MRLLRIEARQPAGWRGRRPPRWGRGFDCLRVLAVIAIGVMHPAISLAAEGIRVDAVRAGTAISITARAVVKAPAALIWSTITDYAHLPEFIPGLKKSRVIGRRGPAAIVEQDGEAGLMFVKFPIHVVVESAEHPPSRISIRVLRGNLKQLEGGYEIGKGASAGEHVLHWSGLIEPDTILPAFIAVPLMRASIENQFVGMVKEIERRYAADSTEVAHVRGN